MFREGIGEGSFAGYHPWVNLTYYIFAVGLTILTLSPWFLAATFVMAWVYSLLLRGTEVLKINLILSLWIFVIMGALNLFFSHEGVTALFYIGDNAVTAEALIYGVSAGIMLVSVILWFSSFNVIMSAEKLIFIFGRALPVLGLTLSMVFRYVPLLKQRFAEIRMGQACLAKAEKPGYLEKVRQFGREVSILISWSLESSIESADSMEARGYGLPGRTSFHLYRFTGRDGRMLALMVLLGGFTAACLLTGTAKVQFYPKHIMPAFDLLTAAALACYCLLLALPILIDIHGELRWRQFDSAM